MSGGPKVLLAEVPGSQTSFTDTATNPDTTYFYEVSAANGAGLEWARSPEASATTDSGDPSLAGWWALGDGAGTTTVDSSGFGRDGVLVNGPVWVSVGRVGGGLSFDGSDDRVDLPSVVLDGASDVTAVLWVKTTKTGQQGVVSAARAGNDNEFLLFLIRRRLFVFTPGGPSTSGRCLRWPMTPGIIWR